MVFTQAPRLTGFLGDCHNDENLRNEKFIVATSARK